MKSPLSEEKNINTETYPQNYISNKFTKKSDENIINIIIEDYNKQILKAVVNNPKINIIAVHVKLPSEKEDIRKKYPQIPVYLTSEIISYRGSYATQTDISKHYKSQVKVDHFFNRLLDCTESERWAYYYSSLSFWINILNENKVDCVLIGQIDHGSPADTLLMDQATERGIPTYVFEIMLYNYNTHNSYIAIKDCNHNRYLELSKYSTTPITLQDIDAYINDFRTTRTQTNVHTSKLKYENIPTSLSKTLKKHVAMIINCVTLFPSVISHITRKSFDRTRAGLNIFQRLVRIYHYLNYWRLWLTGKKIVNELQGLTIFDSPIHYIKGWHAINCNRRYYNKHSVKTIPKGEKYILYALHLEPEASFMARTTYNSQLYNITALAESLPDGYTLYVKEHPVQFDQVKGAIYLKKHYKYRDYKYYDYINSLPNTYLLDYRISSSNFTNKSIETDMEKPRAISTINGTITLEAVVNSIPVIVFDKSTISYDSPLIHGIDDLNKLSEILQRISNETIKPNNIDEILNSLRKTVFVCTQELLFQLPDDFILNLIFNSRTKQLNVKTQTT